jgi:hypothetical protein
MPVSLKLTAPKKETPDLLSMWSPPLQLPAAQGFQHLQLNCSSYAIWSSEHKLCLLHASEGHKGKDSLTGSFETLNGNYTGHLPSTACRVRSPTSDHLSPRPSVHASPSVYSVHEDLRCKDLRGHYR